MNVCILYPPSPLYQEEIIRAYLVVKNRLGSDEDIVFVAALDQINPVQVCFENQKILCWQQLPINFISNIDIVVFVEGYQKQNYLNEWRVRWPHSESIRKYIIHMGTRLRLIEPELYDDQEFSHINAHVFERLSRRQNGYQYLPYGPTLSDTEMGHVNEFGFRVPDEYPRLASRNSNHKVVAIFGGSSAFSFYCFDHEMFSSKLESNLNQIAREDSSNIQYTVLNFGMHDNVVIQEMFNFMVYASPIQPDIVISHGGHNDLYYGLQDDPLLLNKFSIIYQRLHEQWARIIQNGDESIITQNYSISHGKHEMNIPTNVIDVFISRKKQFQQMVMATGAVFIWGLQPLHSSKSKLSVREELKNTSVNIDPSPYRKKWIKTLYHVYDLLSARLVNEPDIVNVDFHKIFNQFGDEKELFWDYVHLSPCGDEIIAEIYAKTIVNLVAR